MKQLQNYFADRRNRFLMAICLIVVILTLICSFWLLPTNNATYLYRTLMLTDVPPSVHDLHGSGRHGVIPIFDASFAHLTYTIDSTYITWIIKYKPPLGLGTFHVIECSNINRFPQDILNMIRISDIDTIGKTCIEGRVDDALHLLIYDASNNQVNHLVVGLTN